MTVVERVVIIDGYGPEPVRMVSGPLAGLVGCRTHCAAHGSGPYHCCRCGATFEPVDLDGGLDGESLSDSSGERP